MRPAYAQAREARSARRLRPSAVKGSLMGAPRAAILKPRAPLTRASRRERLGEADDPGIPPKACARRPPRPDRVTPAGKIGPWTEPRHPSAFRRLPQAPHPSPRGGTVPVTHPSWERDGSSLTEARSAGILRGTVGCRLVKEPINEIGKSVPIGELAVASGARGAAALENDEFDDLLLEVVVFGQA